MRLSLCNEVLRHLPFAEQCDFAATLGYEGLEIAPFTLAEDPTRLSGTAVGEVRKALADAGLAATGLHWLLLAPKGLSITDPDEAVRARTREAMERLCGLAADLEAPVLVHGSPQQRRTGGDPDAIARAVEMLAFAGEAAGRAGVTYCLEPLAPRETDFVNTVAEAAEIVRRLDLPGLRTMIDCSAAGQSEGRPVEAVIREWLPSGLLRHVQVNDPNRRGPGEGELAFAPILRALVELGYQGDVAVEPFDYRPDGGACAARAIGYLKGILEAIR
ncbi:MAG: sugar phosphate isomerase/epimerase family protein [Tistlia sp.]|uniref:sugar phosphate isomerase/epimerase family protein n=1 Tax=Tistlia sp. TaxID=3057121 RepID=UPI0034A394E6